MNGLERTSRRAERGLESAACLANTRAAADRWACTHVARVLLACAVVLVAAAPATARPSTQKQSQDFGEIVDPGIRLPQNTVIVTDEHTAGQVSEIDHFPSRDRLRQLREPESPARSGSQRTRTQRARGARNLERLRELEPESDTGAIIFLGGQRADDPNAPVRRSDGSYGPPLTGARSGADAAANDLDATERPSGFEDAEVDRINALIAAHEAKQEGEGQQGEGQETTGVEDEARDVVALANWRTPRGAMPLIALGILGVLAALSAISSVSRRVMQR